MMTWKLVALSTGVMYALYNTFVRLAAGKISDVYGALILEITATFLLGILMLIMSLRNAEVTQLTADGLKYMIAAGVCVAFLSVLHLSTFRLGGALSVAGPFILVTGSVLMVLIGIFHFGETLAPRILIGLLFGVVSLYLLGAKA